MRVYFTRVRIRVSRAISTRGCGPARLETLRSVVVDVVRPVRGRKPRLARGHRRARDRAERSRTRPIDMGVGDEDHEKSGEIVGSDGEGTGQSSRDLLALMSADAPKKSATGDDKGTRGSSAPAETRPPPTPRTRSVIACVTCLAWTSPPRARLSSPAATPGASTGHASSPSSTRLRSPRPRPRPRTRTPRLPPTRPPPRTPTPPPTRSPQRTSPTPPSSPPPPPAAWAFTPRVEVDRARMAGDVRLGAAGTRRRVPQ